MSKAETKEQVVPRADQEATTKKLERDGWKVVGYDFAAEGPSHVKLLLKRAKPPTKVKQSKPSKSSVTTKKEDK